MSFIDRINWEFTEFILVYTGLRQLRFYKSQTEAAEFIPFLLLFIIKYRKKCLEMAIHVKINYISQ